MDLMPPLSSFNVKAIKSLRTLSQRFRKSIQRTQFLFLEISNLPQHLHLWFKKLDFLAIETVCAQQGLFQKPKTSILNQLRLFNDSFFNYY